MKLLLMTGYFLTIALLASGCSKYQPVALELPKGAAPGGGGGKPVIMKPDQPEKITFAMVDEGVIKSSCLQCHSAQGGNAAELNLESYSNVFESRREIRQAVLDGRMPPAPIQLTADQKDLLVSWIDVGALENGHPAVTEPQPTPPMQLPAPVPVPGPAPLPTPIPAPQPAPVPTPPPAPVPDPQPELNFEMISNHVLKPSCVKCHSEISGSGGVSLENYEAVARNLPAIKGAIEGGFMPPRRLPPLTDSQKNQILSWINNGAPK